MKKFLLLAITTALSFQIIAQDDCPSFLSSDVWDPITFIKTQTPTDASKADGLWLGQGALGGLASPEEIPIYIPSNKPSWAIAVAHAWSYHRNIINRVEYPKMGHLLATLRQETEGMCSVDAQWSDPNKAHPLRSISATIFESASLQRQNNGGCFQIEEQSAYYNLPDIYPSRFRAKEYDNLVLGPDNFETSALVKTYYDLYTPYLYNYFIDDFSIYQTIDCTSDAFAYGKTISSAYNAGQFGFQNNQTFFAEGPDNPCWSGLASTTAGYPSSVARYTAVLENELSGSGDCAPDGIFGEYYEEEIAWDDLTGYLTIISKLYFEIDFENDVTPKVQQAWEEIAGSTTATINYKELGPIIDQIILTLPREVPLIPEENFLFRGCQGDTVPYGHVEIISGGVDENIGAAKVIIGNSITLNLVVDNGGGDSPSYKWHKKDEPSTILSNESSLTITPTLEGSEIYVGQICNGDKCYTVNSNAKGTCGDQRNLHGIEVITEEGQVTSSNSAYLVEQISVFPNPVLDVVNIELGEVQASSINIFDINGVAVFTKSNVNDSNFSFNFLVPKGIYIIEIDTGEKVYRNKLIKK